MKNTLICVICVLLLSACSGTYLTYIDSIRLATMDLSIKLPSLERVRASKSDLMYLQQDDTPSAVLALAYIEQDGYKWVSADKVILVIQNGVITRTVGRLNDLLYSNGQPKLNKNADDNIVHTGINDFYLGEYGIEMTYSKAKMTSSTLDIYGQNIPVFHFTQAVTMSGDEYFIASDATWVNEYWFSQDDFTLLKSKQQLHPNEAQLTMTYLSRIARMVP